MAEQKPMGDLEGLMFDAHYAHSQTIDMTTGVISAPSVTDTITFHSFNRDDRLRLGSITLAKGFPDDSVQRLPPDGITLDALQAQGVLSAEQVRTALHDMADEDIYPKLLFCWPVTVAGEPTEAQHLFLKRICLDFTAYVVNKSTSPLDGEDGIACPHDSAINLLRDEVQVLQRIAQHPQHPNIVKYHGCRVRRGFVTGIVLERVNGPTLYTHMEEGGTFDKTRFIAAIRSAVSHLHSVVGVAHNDINPSNIMVEDGMPILIDFGSCRPLGWRIGNSGGTPGWDLNSLVPSGTFAPRDHFSRTTVDLLALNKVSDWIDSPESEHGT